MARNKTSERKYVKIQMLFTYLYTEEQKRTDIIYEILKDRFDLGQDMIYKVLKMNDLPKPEELDLKIEDFYKP